MTKWAVGLCIALATIQHTDVAAIQFDEAKSVSLQTIPQRIFVTDAIAKERLEGSVFFALVDAVGTLSFAPTGLRIEYLSEGRVVRRDDWEGETLQNVTMRDYPAERLYEGEKAAIHKLPYAFRLALTFPRRPKIDSIRLQLRSDKPLETIEKLIKLERYTQHTKLIFPFIGHGMISSGGVLNGGHRNRSGLYALDILGLNDTFGPLRTATSDGPPTIYAGFGRTILAPAAGVVVRSVNDRPDQPVTDVSNPDYLLERYRSGGDPGNFIVIDHGNGEFSMLAHLQPGTVTLAVGQRVEQGQLIGRLGNSGDTTGPHLHYQLQNGPDWEKADSLPVNFTNVTASARGDFFTAR